MKEKTCQYCKRKFTPWPPTAKVCSLECAANIARKKREKLERADTRKRKEALKTRSDYLKEAQREFNAYVRERDADLPCISCGRFHRGAYDAGHYRSVGAAPALRFNESNVHRQCVPCNQHKSGNAIEYRKGLIRRIGEVAVQEIENDNSTAKWTIEQLKEIKAYYRRKTKELREIHAMEMNDMRLAEVANDNT